MLDAFFRFLAGQPAVDVRQAAYIPDDNRIRRAVVNVPDFLLEHGAAQVRHLDAEQAAEPISVKALLLYGEE